MKSFFRSRVFLALSGILALILVAIVGFRFLKRDTSEKTVYHHRAPSPVLIGDFTVPPLKGWKQDILPFINLPNVTLKKGEKGEYLDIVVYYFQQLNSHVPQNAQQLQSEAQRYLQSQSKTAQLIGTTFQPGPSHITSLNGMIAVETPVTSTNKSGEKTVSNLTHFIYNSHYYLLSTGFRTRKGRALSPTLHRELDEGVSAIHSSLVVKQSSTRKLQ